MQYRALNDSSFVHAACSTRVNRRRTLYGQMRTELLYCHREPNGIVTGLIFGLVEVPLLTLVSSYHTFKVDHRLLCHIPVVQSPSPAGAKASRTEDWHERGG